jgi:hypothetical protein
MTRDGARRLISPSSAEVQPMERGVLLRQLVAAEQGVAESKAFVVQQQRLIVQSERDGQDAAETIRLLDKLLLLQQSREQERARILDELSDAS